MEKLKELPRAFGSASALASAVAVAVVWVANTHRTQVTLRLTDWFAALDSGPLSLVVAALPPPREVGIGRVLRTAVCGE
jgi:hypothetical protein